MKLPTTCAVCSKSMKDDTGWECWFETPYSLDEIKRIPCRRGALPVPPAWCPRRRRV